MRDTTKSLLAVLLGTVLMTAQYGHKNAVASEARKGASMEFNDWLRNEARKCMAVANSTGKSKHQSNRLHHVAYAYQYAATMFESGQWKRSKSNKQMELKRL